MNSEITNKETREIKPSMPENYKNIKPEKGMSVKEADKFWDSEFKKVTEVNNGENNIKEVKYARPSGFREGVRDEVWDNAKDQYGRVRDPVTGRYMSKDQPWDMGHKPGYEFRKHQESAAERGISREQFIDEYNNPDHYRPELPSSNRSHKGEDVTNSYFGD